MQPHIPATKSSGERADHRSFMHNPSIPRHQKPGSRAACPDRRDASAQIKRGGLHRTKGMGRISPSRGFIVGAALIDRLPRVWLRRIQYILSAASPVNESVNEPPMEGDERSMYKHRIQVCLNGYLCVSTSLHINDRDRDRWSPPPTSKGRSAAAGTGVVPGIQNGSIVLREKQPTKVPI